MKVSVLLPTYNRPKLIRRAVNSLLNQSFQDWELLIIENGSNPVDHEVYESYRLEIAQFCREGIESEIQSRFSQIKWIGRLPFASLPAALQVGLEQASGIYAVVLEDDDEWEPEFLSILAAHLDRCICAMVYAWQKEFRNGNEIESLIHAGTKSPPRYSRQQLLSTNWISFPMGMFRRAALMEVGGFDSEMGPATDWDTWCRLARYWPICEIRQYLVRHHWQDDNYCLVPHLKEDLRQKAKLARGEYGEMPQS